MISFSEFQKVDLKSGKILSVEEIEGLDKLYKLQVDMGEPKPRVLLAGIKQFYSPQELMGKDIVVAANLEPREIKGIRSEGMLLAADAKGEPILISPDKEVKPGTKIR